MCMCVCVYVRVSACVLASDKGGRGVGFMLQQHSSKSYKNYSMAKLYYVCSYITYIISN